MSFKEYIISEGVRKELIELSQTASDALWRIARLCLRVYQDFKERQKAGDPKLQDISDYRVWRACGDYANKSGDRIKALASVADVYTPERLGFFTQLYGLWDFGYYERTWRYSEIEQEAIFEFLAAVRDGKFPGITARRLGVGEFMSSYEYHVRHLQVAGPPCPGGFSAWVVGGSEISAAIHKAFSSIRTTLDRYCHNPRVKEYVGRVEEMESELQQLIHEIEVDRRETVSVE